MFPAYTIVKMLLLVYGRTWSPNDVMYGPWGPQRRRANVLLGSLLRRLGVRIPKVGHSADILTVLQGLVSASALLSYYCSGWLGLRWSIVLLARQYELVHGFVCSSSTLRGLLVCHPLHSRPWTSCAHVGWSFVGLGALYWKSLEIRNILNWVPMLWHILLSEICACSILVAASAARATVNVKHRHN